MRPGFNPWVGKFLEGRNGNPLQYSCLENSMDRGAWRVISRESQRVMTEHTVTHTGDLPR